MRNNREIIARVKSKLGTRFPFIGESTASQSTLRFALTTQGTFKQLNFNILENVGTTLGIEKRLKINDVFTVTSWGLFVIKAGTTTAATDTEISSAKHYTNPNALVFSTAGETAALMNLYTGDLQVTIDRNVKMPDFDAYRFYRVGDAQKGLLGGTGGVVTTDDSYPNSQYGFVDLDPELTINGGGTPEIKLNMPNSVSLAGTASTNVVLLICRGILFQNSSQNNA